MRSLAVVRGASIEEGRAGERHRGFIIVQGDGHVIRFKAGDDLWSARAEAHWQPDKSSYGVARQKVGCEHIYDEYGDCIKCRVSIG